MLSVSDAVITDQNKQANNNEIF